MIWPFTSRAAKEALKRKQAESAERQYRAYCASLPPLTPFQLMQARNAQQRPEPSPEELNRERLAQQHVAPNDWLARQNAHSLPFDGLLSPPRQR